MTSLYFEQCIHNTKISTKTLIKLSECQRAFNKLHNLETGKQYYDQLKGLIKMIRYRRIPIKVHPQFECEGYQSTNWNFELIRVAHVYKELLIASCEEEEDLKIKNKLLLEAMRLSNECSLICTSILYDKEHNKLFKFLNPQYHLSQTMRLAASRFYNMYKFKPNYIAIKRAFQLQELSYLLWKKDEDILDVINYKAKALLELAQKLEDDECGQKVALLQKIVLKEGCPEDVKSQYEVWRQQNESVYYQSVLTDKKLDIISLKEAFDILSGSFDIPSK